MQQLGTPTLDFSTLDYADVDRKMKEEFKTLGKEYLIFEVQNPTEQSEEFYQLMGLEKATIVSKLKQMETEFKLFRQQKVLIKAIKFKVGIINSNYNLAKWQILGDIAEELGSPPEHTNKKAIILRYKKYKNLQLSTINQIYGRNMGLKELPAWFPWLKNLKHAIFEINNLSGTISNGQLPPSLVELNLAGNSLTKIDLYSLVHLIKLNLASNQFSEVNLNGLTKL